MGQSQQLDGRVCSLADDCLLATLVQQVEWSGSLAAYCFCKLCTKAASFASSLSALYLPAWTVIAASSRLMPCWRA